MCPTENPVLSEYCINLTGIQQEWVDKGIPLRDCVRDFLKYMKTEVKSRNLLLPKYKNSNLDGNCLMVKFHRAFRDSRIVNEIDTKQ